MRALLLSLLLLSGCAYYSFTGSAVPTHIKTVEVPLFKNEALVHAVAEDVTDEIIARTSRERLKLVSRDPDSRISGVILRYSHKASDYKGTRETTEIKSYVVRVSAKVTFEDLAKSKMLYSGTLQGEGFYDFATENEDIGRKRAIENLVEQIMTNALSGW